MNNEAGGGEGGERKFRQFKGPLGKISIGIAVLFCIYELLYAFGMLTTSWLLIQTTQHASITLAFLLTLTFLWCPSRKDSNKGKLPWYDVLFIVISIAGSSYIAIYFIEVLETSGIPTTLEMTLGLLLTGTILEATRRTMGLTLVIIILCFFFYPLVCNYFPEPFWGKGYSWERLVGAIYLYPDGIFGTPISAVSKLVVVFIMLASFMRVFRADQFFLNLALGIAGHLRGGPAKVAVIASSLFGTISGSATANVATTGMITIPLMKKTGQEPAFAGGVEAMASIGGQIMPPVMGATAFVMADFLDIPYFSICASAAIPAILYYLVAYVTIDAEARKKGLRGLPRETLPSISKTLREGWLFVIPIIVLVYALFFLYYSAQLSAAIAFATLFLVSLFGRERRWTVKGLLEGANGTAQGMMQIGVVCGGAGIIVGSLTLTGMPLRLSAILTDLAGGHLFPLLLLAALTSLILGMGLPGLACYILLVILVAPALIGLGVNPLAAHLFIFWFGVAHFITPPVALAAYVAAGIANASMIKTALNAMRLAIVIYIIPFFYVYYPELLLKGSLKDIILAVILALIGILSVATGLGGYLRRKINMVQRGLLVIGGILVLIKNWEFRCVGFGILIITGLWLLADIRQLRMKISDFFLKITP